MAVDTACSSSLVAVHLACQSLRVGECRTGAGRRRQRDARRPTSSVTFSKLRHAGADGRCKTFDARADGYVRGEGCGMVVLKRLSAMRWPTATRVLARDSRLRREPGRPQQRPDGAERPRAGGRASARRSADAGVEPATCSYVEAHGTGTALGDPIEVEALGAVLGKDARPTSRCVVGSVKTNIGHTRGGRGRSPG